MYEDDASLKSLLIFLCHRQMTDLKTKKLFAIYFLSLQHVPEIARIYISPFKLNH